MIKTTTTPPPKLKNALLIFLFLLGSISAFSQNLQFNQAVFNQFGPATADGQTGAPIYTGQLVVGANQVLKVTFARCSSINATISTLTTVTFGFITVNDVEVAPQTDIWLPSGTYSVKLFEPGSYQGQFKGIISGVLYDIIP